MLHLNAVAYLYVCRPNLIFRKIWYFTNLYNVLNKSSNMSANGWNSSDAACNSRTCQLIDVFTSCKLNFRMQLLLPYFRTEDFLLLFVRDNSNKYCVHKDYTLYRGSSTVGNCLCPVIFLIAKSCTTVAIEYARICSCIYFLSSTHFYHCMSSADCSEGREVNANCILT